MSSRRSVSVAPRGAYEAEPTAGRLMWTIKGRGGSVISAWAQDQIGPSPLWVTKRFPVGASREWRRECAAYRCLSARGFHGCPDMIDRGRLSDGSLTITTAFVRGRPTSDWSGLPDGQMLGLVDTLADLHVRTFARKNSASSLVAERIMRYLTATLAAAWAPDPLVRAIGRLLRNVHLFEFVTALPPSIIHRDVSPGNVLWQTGGSRAILVDWERASVGVGLQDLSRVAFHSNLASSARAGLEARYEQRTTERCGWHSRPVLHRLNPAVVRELFDILFASEMLAYLAAAEPDSPVRDQLVAFCCASE